LKQNATLSNALRRARACTTSAGRVFSVVFCSSNGLPHKKCARSLSQKVASSATMFNLCGDSSDCYSACTLRLSPKEACAMFWAMKAWANCWTGDYRRPRSPSPRLMAEPECQGRCTMQSNVSCCGSGVEAGHNYVVLGASALPPRPLGLHDPGDITLLVFAGFFFAPPFRCRSCSRCLPSRLRSFTDSGSGR
jgi:hypothetical protein